MPKYSATNIRSLIDTGDISLIKNNINDFDKLPFMTQNDIWSRVNLLKLEIDLTHRLIERQIVHNCKIKTIHSDNYKKTNHHDQNIKALLQIDRLSEYRYNDQDKSYFGKSFQLIARIDAFHCNNKIFLKFKQRSDLEQDGNKITPGEKALVLCQMKVFDIEICHFIEYNATALTISEFKFDEIEYQKIEDFLEKLTNVYKDLQKETAGTQYN